MSKRPSYHVSTQKSKAKVVAQEVSYFLCSDDNGTFRAQKAFGCLVVPQIGDTVLLYRDDETTYITDILRREAAQHIEIVAEQLKIRSENELRLEAEEEISVYTPNATAVISKVTLLSKVMTLHSELLNTVVNTAQSFVEHLHMKNSSVTQQVDEHMELQCHSSRKVVTSSDIYSVKEQITTAEGQVKIDADQINMG